MSGMSLAVDLQPSGLEETLLEIGIIGTLIAAIVLGIRALRNRR